MNSTNKLDGIEHVAHLQEEEYWFPYHYISTFGSDGFRQHFNDTWGINYVSTIELILEKLKATSPSKIVDIGCGDGRLSRDISTHFDTAQVLGIDYSSKAINLARAMNPDLTETTFECADITTDHNLGQFDVAILMEVFEHIPLDMAEEFMRGVRNLIKPGGRLLLTVPHANKAVEYKHFQHFTVDGILNYLEPNFEILQVIPFEKRGLRRRLLVALLSNRFFILNNQKILNSLYHWYREKLFFCESEQDCQRIFVEARAK